MRSAHPPWLAKAVDAIVRRRRALLIATVLLTVLAWYPASKLTLEQTIESLYSPTDQRLLEYLRSKKLFGGDEFIIVAFEQRDLPQPEGIRAIRDFAEKLSEVRGINAASTQSLAKAVDFSAVPFFLRRIFNDRMRGKMIELSRGVLIGADDSTAAVVLRLLPQEQTKLAKRETFEMARSRTIHDVRQLAAAHDPPAYVVGEPVQLHDMFRYVEEDGATLFWWSLVLLSCVQFVFFRNLRFVILGIAVIVVAIVWTKAILFMAGMRFSMVSSLLNSLVTIVGIATVTHMLMFYREQREHLSRPDAFRATFVELASPVFWECATTAVGFASLLSSDVGPVNSFGTILTIACMLVLVAVVGILPGGVLLGTIQSDASPAKVEKGLSWLLDYVSRVVTRRPKTILLLTAAVTVLTAMGLSRLQVETDFSRNFRSDSPIVRALDFVETRLGGAGTWEVNFPAPAELDDAFLDKVRHLAGELRSIDVNGHHPLTKVIALTDVYDAVGKIPFRSNTVESRLAALREAQPEYVTSLYNPEHRRMRLVLRALERQPSAEKLALIERVEKQAHAEFGEAETTGLFVLLAYIIESLLRDQLVSFAISTLSILAMMAIAFRSIRIGLISLVPNVFPNVLLIGTLGWLDIPVNIGTAMIASVSIGLTVDASIHYLAGVERLGREGMSFEQALAETQKGVGLALVFATIALVVGFSVLMLSHFIPLVYFGTLVSLAMIGGLLGNIVLLPVLLRMNGQWW